MSVAPLGGPAPVHGAVAQTSEEQRLRKAASQLEGVFIEQLFKAMRETVPKDGITDGGTGEEVFSGMLDQHLATVAPQEWQHGLGEALYRQLRSHLPAAPAAAGHAGHDIERIS